MTLPNTADECVQQTIKECLAGEFVQTEKDSSYEIMHYQTGMTHSRARILTNPNRPLNVVVAVARLAWMLGGNGRLEDIAFYEPKVKGFTDDGFGGARKQLRTEDLPTSAEPQPDPGSG